MPGLLRWRVFQNKREVNMPLKFVLGFAVVLLLSCVVAEKAKDVEEESGGVTDCPDCSECESQVEELTIELQRWQELAEQCVDKKVK